MLENVETSRWVFIVSGSRLPEKWRTGSTIRKRMNRWKKERENIAINQQDNASHLQSSPRPGTADYYLFLSRWLVMFGTLSSGVVSLFKGL